MIAQQPYQAILPSLHLRARVVLQVTRGYPTQPKDFGSLVVVFSTPHEGGVLLTCHRGQECAFDSAAALSTAPPSSIGYAAFFSDVEHEVTPVVSGHRVTLTYNLYFDDDDGRKPAPAGGSISEPTASVPAQVMASEQGFRSAFQALLEDPNSSRMAVYSALGCDTYISSRAVEDSSTSTVCSRGATQPCIEPPAHLG